MVLFAQYVRYTPLKDDENESFAFYLSILFEPIFTAFIQAIGFYL